MVLSKTQRKWLVIAIKLIAAVGIYWFIFWQMTKPDPADPGYDPWETLGRGFTSLLCWGGILLYLIPMLGMSLRWMILMRSQGLHISYRKATEYYFIGQFFNNFALGSVGGDAVRAWYAAKDFPDRKHAAVLTVLMDRAIGMGALGLNAVIGVTVGLSMGLPSAGQVAWVVFSVMGMIVLVITLVFCAPLRRLLHLGKLFAKLPGQKSLAHVREALVLYEGKHKVLIWMVVLSIIDQGVGIVCVMLIGMGFGLQANVLLYLLFVPLAWMISSIPLTPGGAGMQEGALITLFRQAVKAKGTVAAATGMALMNRVMLVFWGLPGAIIYLFIGRRPAKGELAEATEEADAPSEEQSRP